MLLIKDETRELNDNWIADTLRDALPVSEPMAVTINGVSKSLYAFKTGRNQGKDVTRCYFVALGGETRPGDSNRVEITLPIRRGLVFSGAYIDLPDQVPTGQ